MCFMPRFFSMLIIVLAPRALKEPVGFKFSILKKNSCLPNFMGISGVSISPMETSGVIGSVLFLYNLNKPPQEQW